MDYLINYLNESIEDLFKIYDYIANVTNEKACGVKDGWTEESRYFNFESHKGFTCFSWIGE